MNYLLRLTMPILLAVLATTVRANTYTYEFTQKVFSKNGTQSLGGVDWTLQTDGGYFGYDKKKGQQFGKSKKPAKTMTLSTTGIQGTISSVKVETSGAKGTNATLKVTVGGTQIGQAYTLTSASTEIEFKGSGTGEIVLSYGQTSSTAIYIKKIIVDYEESGEPPVVPKPTQKVNGLAALKDIADETPVHLYIADADNARVLFAGNDEAFIRDKDCTVCFSGVKAKPAMAYNQHVAGYIVGKKMTQNGMTTLQAVADTHTAFLVIAAPVQESDVEPAVMKAGEHATHLGDWVTMKNLTMKNGKLEANGQTYMLNNAYGLDGNSFYQQPYEGAIVDLSAIVYPTATGIELRPIYNKVEKTEAHDVEARDFRPLIYVIDEARNFTSPTADIPHATVRLHRTFSPDKWNTLALPFAVTFEGGKLRKYDNVDGQTMKFVEAASVEPGVPYLFKPATAMENPVYKDVTLSKAEAQKITHEGYSYVGTYSPYTLKTDKTECLLGEDYMLFRPDTQTSPDANKLKGMQAYFIVPATAENVKVAIVGEATAIDNITTDRPAASANARVYNLNGQFVGIGTAGLPKGIYIVNGKKMVIN
ncbi:chitobiase [Segatella buccae]